MAEKEENKKQRVPKYPKKFKNEQYLQE